LINIKNLLLLYFLFLNNPGNPFNIGDAFLESFVTSICRAGAPGVP
jgi:hypothetical protein